MSLAQAIRAIDSRKRQYKREAQEAASRDYILADLIGRSISRLHSSSNKMPPINEIYPNLFDDAEIEAAQQERKTELSIMRLKAFSQSFNSKFKEVATDE